MDEVEVFVSEDDRESVLETLEERDVTYAVTAGAPPQADHVKVSFAVPSDGVEPVLDALEDAGLDEDAFTLVSNPEFARSATEQALRERYVREPSRIRAQALDSKVWDRRRTTRDFLALMVLSAGIATVGLLTSTPAILVGSMVITPLLTPILSTGVGAALGDVEMVREGLTSQIAGLATAVGTAALVASVARQLAFVPETLAVTDLPFVTVRLAPGALPLLVAVFAGAAAAYGLATKEFVLLAGVAIAGALLPTAAAAGLGIAWGHWTLAVGASVLVLASVLTINVTGAVTLLLFGYRPEEGLEFSLPSGGGLAVVAIAALLFGALALGAVTGTYQQGGVERDANAATTALLDEPAYDGLEAVNVNVEYAGVGSPPEPETVTVVVSRPANVSHPPVAGPLEERLEARGLDVTVRVRFQEYHHAPE